MFIIKKILCIFLVFSLTFTFTFTSFGSQKASANPIAIPFIQEILYLLGLAAGGVVIGSSEMAKDLVGEIKGPLLPEIRLKDGNYYLEKTFETGLAIMKYKDLIPVEPVKRFFHNLVTGDVSAVGGGSGGTLTYGGVSSVDMGTFTCTTGQGWISATLIASYYYKGVYTEKKINTEFFNHGEYNGVIPLKVWMPTFYQVNFNSSPLDIFIPSSDIKAINFRIVEFKNTEGTYNSSISIPYAPETSQSISADKFLSSLPDDHAYTVNSDVVGANTNWGDLVNDLQLTYPLDVQQMLDKGLVTTVPQNPSIPDTGTDTGILDGILDGVGSIVDSIGGLLDWVASIPGIIGGAIGGALSFPSDMPKLNFQPLYFSFKEKFPFCLPFDFINLISVLNADPVEPVFKIPFGKFLPVEDMDISGSTDYEVDLTIFDKLFGIVRIFILITYIGWLTLKTREIIQG